MLKNNQAQLIEWLLEGIPASIKLSETVDVISGLGGLALNLKVGDSAFGWAVDHASTCVSIKALGTQTKGTLPFLACLGNEVRLLSGEAKGTHGLITGISRAHDLVMIDFPDSIFEHISLEDRIQVRACGQGLSLLDYQDVLVGGISADLLDKMKIEEDVHEHQLRIPVTAKIPAELLMSANQQTLGVNLDLNLSFTDPERLKAFQLEHLRLGDVVALTEHPARYRGGIQQEMVSIGIVTYTASTYRNVGPGIQTILAAKADVINPFLLEDANIGRYLNLGRYRHLF